MGRWGKEPASLGTSGGMKNRDVITASKTAPGTVPAGMKITGQYVNSKLIKIMTQVPDMKYSRSPNLRVTPLTKKPELPGEKWYLSNNP